jgi:hypothetical protein
MTEARRLDEFQLPQSAAAGRPNSHLSVVPEAKHYVPEFIYDQEAGEIRLKGVDYAISGIYCDVSPSRTNSYDLEDLLPTHIRQAGYACPNNFDEGSISFTDSTNEFPGQELDADRFKITDTARGIGSLAVRSDSTSQLVRLEQPMQGSTYKLEPASRHLHHEPGINIQMFSTNY